MDVVGRHLAQEYIVVSAVAQRSEQPFEVRQFGAQTFVHFSQ
jgi:hypothetical protein